MNLATKRREIGREQIGREEKSREEKREKGRDINHHQVDNVEVGASSNVWTKGQHTVHVTDSKGCYSTQVVSVPGPNGTFYIIIEIIM